MILSKIFAIPSGEKVLFDTNIFIYSALDHPRYGDICTNLIYEVESGEIGGYIQIGFARNTKDAINALKHDNNIIPSLNICWEELDRRFEMHFTILEEKAIRLQNQFQSHGNIHCWQKTHTSLRSPNPME